jgi:hypothetical protein
MFLVWVLRIQGARRAYGLSNTPVPERVAAQAVTFVKGRFALARHASVVPELAKPPASASLGLRQ